MKKILIFLFPLIASLNLYAQSDSFVTSPYKASVGGSFNLLFPSLNGITFKMPISEHCYWDVDYNANPKFTKGRDLYGSSFSVDLRMTLNTNFMYQNKAKDLKESTLYWFAGMGVLAGCDLLIPTGLAAANLIGGIEFVRNSFAFQLDLRPGFGCKFSSQINGVEPTFLLDANFSVRYLFK